jgi:hypothetical protein
LIGSTSSTDLQERRIDPKARLPMVAERNFNERHNLAQSTHGDG